MLLKHASNSINEMETRRQIGEEGRRKKVVREREKEQRRDTPRAERWASVMTFNKREEIHGITNEKGRGRFEIEEEGRKEEGKKGRREAKAK